METFEQWSVRYLVDRGMFENQAAQVFQSVKSDEVNAPMAKRWNDTIDGYPPVMLNVLALGLNRAATQWIDANLPNAWYRPVFAQGFA
jgi:hypothetical protein